MLKAHADSAQKQHFLEDCLYELYSKFHDIKEFKGLKLRVEMYLAVLLSRDKGFEDRRVINRLLEDPMSLIDQYDYRRFPELGQFLTAEFIPYAIEHYDPETLNSVIAKTGSFLLSSLISNLEYCMTKEEILCYSDFAFDERLVSRVDVLEAAKEALSIGKNSLVVKRPVIDKVYKAIIGYYDDICARDKLLSLAPLVLLMIQTEEYRGFDG